MLFGSVGYEAQVNEKGERVIWPEERWINKLRALRGPGEDWSDVIIRLAGLEPWPARSLWRSPLQRFRLR
jgi:hypothetical protein